YDELINEAGRNRDFAAVRDLISRRLAAGCFNTNNTFKFIAAEPSAVEELRKHLCEIRDWFTRKQAHDALVSQLSRLNRTADALAVAEAMARSKIGSTAVTFHPILNALAKKKEMKAAWEAVEVMRGNNVKPDVAAYNYILTAYCTAGDVSSAAETLSKMEEEGISADAVTYDALALGACRAGKVEAALAIIRREIEDGFRPLFSTHLHIIKELVSRGYCTQAAEFVRAFAGNNEKLGAECFGFLLRRLTYAKRTAEAEAVAEEMYTRGL
ncbi:hypothetical protein M569_06026, partial [Genlisea aurea]